MTVKELERALLSKVPVIYNGIRYKRVTAVIEQLGNEGRYFSAELLDRTERSVTIARADKITLAPEGGAV